MPHLLDTARINNQEQKRHVEKSTHNVENNA
jgi:hypothetical protein